VDATAGNGPADRAADVAADQATGRAADNPGDRAGGKALDKARDEASSPACGEAEGAPWDKARDKARDKGWDKARDKARNKAGDNARDKDWDRAWDKAGDKARAIARDEVPGEADQADDKPHGAGERAHDAGADAARATAWTGPALRALVIDEVVPAAGRDAGSQAILSHMRALVGLGYDVNFVAAEAIADRGPEVAALAASGVTCCGAPFYASVEELLRRQADCFDVVYLHRVGVATRYLGLARRSMPRARIICSMPRARIIYSVADLHHVRLERQAVVEERPELHAASRRARLEECVAAWSADAVISHSADEVELLRRAVPEANVYRVPWQVPLRSRPGGAGPGRADPGHAGPMGAAPLRGPSAHFVASGGVAFIGGYAHAPNVDAARWLVEAVMPLVWQQDPVIDCLLVGSAMPETVRRLARPGVVALGEVADLGSVFDRVRLTVAPLRYGAGVKGKVLESLAAGVPCVMTPVAAEGLGLPASLQALVGTDAAQLATLISRVHRDETAHHVAACAGRALIRDGHNERAVMSALRAAIEGHGQAAKPEAGVRTSTAA